MATALVPVGLLAAAATAAADHQDPAAATHSIATGDHGPLTPQRQAAAAVTPAPVITPSPAAKPVPAPAPAAPPETKPASVTDGSVPDATYEAYRNAADILAKQNPQCGIGWTLIAGIGRVESQHADNGDVDSHGTLRTPIYGPTLDGSLAGNQVVMDTDGGKLDGDPVHDRAVGPMQFLPATWEKYAADANGDGIADPQNIGDAALTTGKYLCDGHLNLRDAAQQITAVLRYNNSMTYVDDVLGFSHSY